MSRDLYTYRCSFCKTTAQTTIRTSGYEAMPLKCSWCRRTMGYLFAAPISEDEWQARNLNPPVYQSPHEVSTTPYTKRACDTCKQHVERDTMIALSGVGKFCSEDCAQVGVLEHEKFMQRMAKLHQEMPWLRSSVKESKAS